MSAEIETSSPIANQPTSTAPPDYHGRLPLSARVRNRLQHTAHKLSTKDGWIGDYDFGWLCSPGLPWNYRKRTRMPPFYALDADLPVLLSIVIGFQHSLAMVGSTGDGSRRCLNAYQVGLGS